MRSETAAIAEQLIEQGDLQRQQMKQLLASEEPEVAQMLAKEACRIREQYYGKAVYLRGLIEISNYCKNDCYYCGIRRDNPNVQRYRLLPEDIYNCCEQGYALGYRTFVLQGGEDAFYTPAMVEEIVREIKRRWPDCAVTLSLGEHTRQDYIRWYEAGADRYLLRHETANAGHYKKLHPEQMSFSHRMQCLVQLKEIGYQVGAGFMVGSPEQTLDCLCDDLAFLKEFQPAMVGIGPFISQKDTPFANASNGTLAMTLKLLSIIRILLPYVLLPATTALGTIHPQGRECGLQSGANVVMPNLSPVRVRSKYALYDNKICTGEEAAECRGCLARRVEAAGYHIVNDRGDVAKHQ